MSDAEDWESALLNGEVGHAPLRMTEPPDARPRVTLPLLAAALGKDVRTVRRYCEQGLIPGAYRTKGGHWRFRGGKVFRASLVARLATIKTRRSKRWDLKTQQSIIGKMDTDLLLVTSLSHMAGIGIPRGPHFDKARAILKHQREKTPDVRHLSLVVALQELRAYHEDERPSGKKIAEAMGISLRTFRSRYKLADLEAAHRVASS
jgi:DNA-binding transcriptional MerR regulator